MLSPNRTHDRQSFFKYMSASTARIVLGDQTLRWSSPVLFNDPFDVPREISFGLTPMDITNALAVRMIDLIEHPPADSSNLKAKLRLVVDALKLGVSQELKDHLIESVREVNGSFQPTGESMEAFRAMWRALLPDFRLLCLTESPDHIAMWHHYADQYRGAVLEFKCDDKRDSAWLAAKKVEYPLTKPAVYTPEGWAEILTMPHEVAVRTILDVSTFTKAPDWSYEREWRVTSFKRPTDRGHFTDYSFHTDELAAVFLGPMISSSDREQLTALVARYPAASVWDVTIGMDREFKFTQVGG